MFDAGLAKFEAVTVIKVENDWNKLVLWVDFTSVFNSTLSHVTEHGLVGVFASACRDLKDNWGFSFDASSDDGLKLFHLGEVVSWNSIATIDSLSEDIFAVNETESLV